MKKTIISIIIILLIAAASYFTYIKYFAWNIYTNDVYKYSIKYPKNWFIDNQFSDKTLELREGSGEYIGGDTGISNYELKNELNEEKDLSFVFYNFQKVNPNVSIDNFIDVKDIEAKKVDTQDIMVGDVKGIKYTIQGITGIGGSTKENNVTILLKKSDILLNISYGFDKGNEMNIETMNKIIDSIKW